MSRGGYIGGRGYKDVEHVGIDRVGAYAYVLSTRRAHPGSRVSPEDQPSGKYRVMVYD